MKKKKLRNKIVAGILALFMALEPATMHVMAEEPVAQAEFAEGEIDYVSLVEACEPAEEYRGVIVKDCLEQLHDGDTTTIMVDFNTTTGKGFTLDFGASGRVSISGVQMQAATELNTRMAGGRIKGSNDNVNWQQLNETNAVATAEMQTLPINEEYQDEYWRYIRIEGDGNGGWFRLSELVLLGDYTTVTNALSSVTIESSNDTEGIAVEGDTITVNVEATEAITDVNVLFKNAGALNQTAKNFDVSVAATGSGTQWSASYTVGDYAFEGEQEIQVTYKVASTGKDGIAAEATTDDSKVEVVQDTYIDITDAELGIDFGIAAYDAGTDTFVPNYEDAAAETQIGYITDKVYLSNSEQKPNNNSWAGAIFLDFGEGQAVYLHEVKVLGRDGFSQAGKDRISGLRIEASNDGSNWAAITGNAVLTNDWQTLTSTDKATQYRYLKITGNQFLNISEIRFYGRVRSDSALYLYGLQDAIAEGNEILAQGQQNFSDESWNQFVEELNAAKEMWTTLEGDANAYTQDVIDAETEALVTAIASIAEPLPYFVNTEGTALAHPAIGISGSRLEEVREHIVNGDQPWADYFEEFSKTNFASKSYVSRNDGKPGTDDIVANYGYGNYSTNLFNNQMTQDAKAAYYQALMYYFTGDADYRANAIRILRLWYQVNPEECTYTADAHIHMGAPVTNFNAAAELIRYTSTFETDAKYVWTEEDSEKWYTNFVEPPLVQWLDKNNYWLNQQQFSNMAAMSSYIFNDDKENYEKLVERTMVNDGLTDPDEIYQNGSIASAFYAFDVDYQGNQLDKTYYALKEMSRDQSHSFENVRSAGILAQLLIAQGTKVDPVTGEASTEANAVNAYEFANRAILKATNTFCAFAMGYPIKFSDSRPGYGPSDAIRGRLNDIYQVYHYYKYAMGYTEADEDFKYIDKYVKSYNAGFGMTIDETWIYLPEEVTGTDIPNLVSNRTGGAHQVETEYTDLSDSQIEVVTDGNTQYLNIQATAEGTPFVLYGGGSWGSRIDFCVSTTESAMIARYDEATGEVKESYYVPDTDGQWRYCSYSFGSGNEMLFVKVIGQGEVKLDSYKVNDAGVTPPVFTKGLEQDVYGYCGQNLTLTVEATDSNAGDTITYSLADAPDGAAIANDGTFTWSIPAEQTEGKVSFYVLATDGTAVSSLTVNVYVQGDYEATIANIISPFDENAVYESKTLETYELALAYANSVAESGDVERTQALADLQNAVAGLRLLNPKTGQGGLDLGLAVQSVENIPIGNMAILVDESFTSGTNIVWGNAKKSFTMDFGVDFQVSVSEVIMAGALDWEHRGDGMQIFGSNDNKNWEPMLKEVSENKQGWQNLAVKDELKTKKYRFLKVIDLNGGVLNREQTTEDQPFTIAELHLVGERYETVNEIVNVSLTSDVACTDTVDGSGLQYYYAGKGDTLTLTFEATQELASTQVTIAGQSVTAQKDAQTNVYTASLVLENELSENTLPFTIDYTCQDGRVGNTVYFATDGSYMLMNGRADDITETIAQSTITSSNNSGTVGLMFDGDLTNCSDARGENQGWGAWIQFDLGNSKVKLSGVDILARRDKYFTRTGGTYVQGSNDGETWYTLTTGAASVLQWQQLSVLDAEKDQAYRYIRLSNGGNWFGNITEIRFFGECGEDVTSGNRVDPVYSVETKASTAEGGTTIAFINETDGNLPTVPGENYTTTKLENLAQGTSVTVVARPAQGYKFVEWISEEEIMGEAVNDYLWSTYPMFTLINYGGGYLGAPTSFGVNKDWKLTAVFEKIEEEPVPTAAPTAAPTTKPTAAPTTAPTTKPTTAPTAKPTTAPTAVPTTAPTAAPTTRPTTAPTAAPVQNGWDVVGGMEYWYEDGVLQGTEGRGKEIYDPVSNAWYWLDSVLGGAVAKSKDVYQESEAGPWADRADGTGKWVRYDENGHMIKGWQDTGEGKYYFDTIYGTMAKGYATIEGIEYYFDEATGVLATEIGQVPESGWKVMDGMSYWYEGSARQGFKVDDSYRGKEIYDAESDAWYWLDNVLGGAKAVSKDVYQESYSAYPDREDGTGKWVRYDENGRMVKGWQYTDAGTYYFEEITGSMAKGRVTINGQEYYFDEATGILQ